MKKIYLLLLLAISATLYAQDRFYVHQKDGVVKCFLCEDVDSIIYSQIDTAGITQADFVTQKICLQDTVIVMPVASIDSVSFQKPEMILCDNVVTLSSDFLQYVAGWEDDTILYVSSSIPQKLLPEIGQILYYEKSSPTLPYGFVGRVLTLTNEISRWKIVTETPSILDVYERFILAEPYRELQSELKASTLSLYNNTFETNIDKLGFSGSLSLTVYKTDHPIINIENKQLKYFYLMFDCGVDIGAGIKKELEKKQDLSSPLGPQIKIPIPNSVFSIKLDPAIYACMEGKLELNCSFRNQFRERFGVAFSEGQWIPFAHPVRSGAEKPSADIKLNLDGSIGFGLQFGVGVGFTFGKDNMGFRGRIGPKLSANLSFDVGKSFDQISFYPANKEAKIGTDVSWSISAMLPQLIIDNLEDAGFEAKWEIGGAFAKDHSFLFPDFTYPKIVYKNERGTDVQAISTVSRKTYLDSQVGLALYKEKQAIKQSDIETYTEHDLMISTNFFELEEKTTYRIYPIVKQFGTWFLANQVTEFTTKEKPEEPVEPGLNSSLIGKWEYYEKEVHSDGHVSVEHFIYQFNVDGTFSWTDMNPDGSVDDVTRGTFVYDKTAELLTLSVGSETFSTQVKITENALSIHEGEEWVEYKKLF